MRANISRLAELINSATGNTRRAPRLRVSHVENYTWRSARTIAPEPKQHSHRHGYDNDSSWKTYTGLLATGAAITGSAILADQLVSNDGVDKSSKRFNGAARCGGYASSRYDSLPDMIDDVFPGLCKMMGSVGGRKLGGGSGFLISEDGLLVTNAHVFVAMSQAGALELQAVFDDGRAYRVEHVASDLEADIAVGRIIAPLGTKFKHFRIGKSSSMRRGDLVAVLGAPLGGGLVPSVGVLSGIRYVADDEIMHYVLGSRSDWCLLQVDASMSSGSSGGPIVNADGEVVGVSVMVQTAAGMGGVGFVNYGVAIDQAWPVIQSLVTKGAVSRSFIGMTIMGVDRLQNEREMANIGVSLLPPPASNSSGNSEYNTGLLVTYVVPGRPAESAGIREGDVLLEMDGRKLVRKGDYFAALGPVYDPGRRLHCKVYRPPPPGSRPGAPGTIFTATITPDVRDEEAHAQPPRRKRVARRAG